MRTDSKYIESVLMPDLNVGDVILYEDGDGNNECVFITFVSETFMLGDCPHTTLVGVCDGVWTYHGNNKHSMMRLIFEDVQPINLDIFSSPSWGLTISSPLHFTIPST